MQAHVDEVAGDRLGHRPPAGGVGDHAGDVVLAQQRERLVGAERRAAGTPARAGPVGRPSPRGARVRARSSAPWRRGGGRAPRRPRRCAAAGRRTSRAARRRTPAARGAARGPGRASVRARGRPEAKKLASGVSTSRSRFMWVTNRPPLTAKTKSSGVWSRQEAYDVGPLQRVERAVDLDAAEPLGGVGELLALRQPARVEVAAPAGVRPAGDADADLAHVPGYSARAESIARASVLRPAQPRVTARTFRRDVGVVGPRGEQHAVAEVHRDPQQHRGPHGARPAAEDAEAADRQVAHAVRAGEQLEPRAVLAVGLQRLPQVRGLGERVAAVRGGRGGQEPAQRVAHGGAVPEPARASQSGRDRAAAPPARRARTPRRRPSPRAPRRSSARCSAARTRPGPAGPAAAPPGVRRAARPRRVVGPHLQRRRRRPDAAAGPRVRRRARAAAR